MKGRGNLYPLKKPFPTLTTLTLHYIIPKFDNPNTVRRRGTRRDGISSELRGEVIHLPPVDRKIIHETTLRTAQEKLLQIIFIPQLLRPSLGKACETLSQRKNLFVHRIRDNPDIRKPLSRFSCQLSSKSPLLPIGRFGHVR